MPKVSVIVSIGLDHTQILGETRAEIAAEKAGVIKAGRPVVVGAVPDDAMAVIESQAADSGAPMWRLGREVLWQHSSHGVSVQTPRGYYSDLQTGIQGAMQHHNLAVAVAALDAAELIADEELLKAGAAKASLPGRLQQMRFTGREFVLDGAHNADAGRVLRESMAALLSERGSNSKAILLTNMVLGHDPAGFYREIAPLVASAHVVPIDFHRAMSVADTSAILRSMLPRVETHASIQDGLEAAVREAAPDDLVLVTGSFYLVGEVGRAMTVLGTSPLCSRP